jgi:hypothetical protein
MWLFQYLIKCLKENLEFWLRFSTSVHQIQKFQTSIQDLHAELQKLKDKKQEELFKRMLKFGVDPDEVVYITMIDGYSKNGRAIEARQ